MSLTLPYYYGHEAEQFAFYRVPKLLITDVRYKGISTDAKLLYGLMLDRMSLSVRNGWIDEYDRVFIYFPVEQIMELLNCRSEKATKLLAELDSVKGIGLIERVRQGRGNRLKASAWCTPYTTEKGNGRNGKPIIPMKRHFGERNSWI